jgi:hypothetical protein
MAGSDVRAITFLNNLSANTTSLANAATTSGTASLSLKDAAGTGAFHSTGQSCKVTLTSSGDLSARTVTITGTDIVGNAQTENITGPNSTTVTSTKFYDTVTSVAGNASLGSAMSVGNAAGTTGGKAKIFGGRTRLRGMHITTGGNIGDISFFNTTPTTGTALFSIKVATTTKDYIDPYIPDEGLVFSGGCYVDLPAGTAVSATMFFN